MLMNQCSENEINCILRTHFAAVAAALDQLFISRTRTLNILPDIEARGSSVIVGDVTLTIQINNSPHK